MMEFSEPRTEILEQSAADAATQLTKANKHALDFMGGAQKIVLEEMVFAGNELLERARTETHLLSEFVSKMAGSHSVKDLKTMYEECGRHQIDFYAATVSGCSNMANGCWKPHRNCSGRRAELSLVCHGFQC